jgi:hypothetical protein
LLAKPIIYERGEKVLTMGSTWTQTPTLLAAPVCVSADSGAHLTVGVTTLWPQVGATGGYSICEQLRITNRIVRILPITDALYGTSVSAAQGSLKPEAFAPMGASTSGVPPRSRPV